MDSLLKYPPSVVSAYVRRGEAGISELADEIEEAAHDRPGEKFSKKEAVYLPQAPVPPTLWRMSCGRCRFWEAGEPGEAGHCHIVGREDDRFGGEAIHYRGWCALWTPPKGEPPFAWIKRRLRPDGKSSVRGVYDPEMTEKERRRKTQEKELTEPDARRAAIRGEEIEVEEVGAEGIEIEVEGVEDDERADDESETNGIEGDETDDE